MSHMLKAQLKVKTANAQLIGPAMAMLAAELGGRVVDTVKDFYGKSHDVVAGLVAPDIRGFGVQIDKKTGKLFAVGDDYRAKITMAEFMKRFEQAYQGVAFHTALAQLGYSVSTSKIETGLLVTGVKVGV